MSLPSYSRLHALPVPVILTTVAPLSLAAVQDTDASADLGKHQTNISELKRSFLETGDGHAGATEWEKRLSSSPAHSFRADEPPMIEPLLLPQDVSPPPPHPIQPPMLVFCDWPTNGYKHS